MFSFCRSRLILSVALVIACLAGMGAGLIAASTEEKKPSRRRPENSFPVSASKTEGRREARPGKAATYLSVGTKKPETMIVAPHNESVVLSGHLDVIYRGCNSPLKVDSKPVAWEDDIASPMRVRRLHLTPGMHLVQISEKKIKVCVALNELEHDGPSDWKIFRAHGMGNDEERCAECHDTESHQGRTLVGDPLVPEACIACHTAGDTKETHQALIQPLKLCQTCHAMHGSPNPSLLKAPKAEILKKYAAPK